MQNHESWEAFIRHAAQALMEGRLTTQDLRQAVKHPEIREAASKQSFRIVLVETCERLSPSSTRQSALMQEIDSADRRLNQLLDADAMAATAREKPA
jgi:hypothetical protein